MADVSVDSNLSFLKVYGGEVINAYNAQVAFAPLLTKRVITSGSSASFPTFTREQSKLHTPGDDVFGAVANDTHYASGSTSGEKVITLEKAIIAPQFVDDLDQAMADYNIHSELAKQAGAAMAFTHDAMLISALSRGGTGLAEIAGGTANAAVDGAQIAVLIEEAAQKMDEAFVPHTERYCALPPRLFYALMGEDNVVGSDFNSTGDRGKTKSLWYMGFEIINSQVLGQIAGVKATGETSSNVGGTEDPGGAFYLGQAAGAGKNVDYGSMDSEKLSGLCFHKSSAATLLLRGVSTESNYIPNRLGHLLNAKQAIGCDILRPDSVIQLKTNDA